MNIDSLLSRRITRRQLIKGSLLVYFSGMLGGFGCSRRQYIRRAEKCWIGIPENFFFPAQPALEAALLIKRDAGGWSALDARCTVEGCDLSFNGKFLVCPCCRSAFNLEGKIISPPAQDALKHWRMDYESESLIVFVGDSVLPETRFITPALDAKMKELEKSYKEKGLTSITKPDTEIVDPRTRPDANQFISDADVDAQRMKEIYKNLKK